MQNVCLWANKMQLFVSLTRLSTRGDTQGPTAAHPAAGIRGAQCYCFYGRLITKAIMQHAILHQAAHEPPKVIYINHFSSLQQLHLLFLELADPI